MRVQVKVPQIQVGAGVKPAPGFTFDFTRPRVFLGGFTDEGQRSEEISRRNRVPHCLSPRCVLRTSGASPAPVCKPVARDEEESCPSHSRDVLGPCFARHTWVTGAAKQPAPPAAASSPHQPCSGQANLHSRSPAASKTKVTRSEPYREQHLAFRASAVFHTRHSAPAEPV